MFLLDVKLADLYSKLFDSTLRLLASEATATGERALALHQAFRE